MELILFFAGLVAGFIDSIAGGGGLITLPVLSLYLLPGPHSIGTNKIVGTVGALTALIIYSRKGHLQIGKGLRFVLLVGTGSFLGSSSAPYLPIHYFKILLIILCPLLLLLVWHKDKFIREDVEYKVSPFIFILTGVFCGFYDGFFGPAGGTFMLLGLLYAVKLPLFAALAISKLANTLSAGVALATYSTGGFVHWKTGLIMMAGMAPGAFFGAHIASKKADKIVKPVLTFIVCLLLLKLILNV
ncbi:MAG: sulfite exporter TauE/SafE family protein [Bdellovibrio sp.]|nr:sulfite exporter TauE/SafE family protein [Bdellovibrio sp.]